MRAWLFILLFLNNAIIAADPPIDIEEIGRNNPYGMSYKQFETRYSDKFKLGSDWRGTTSFPNAKIYGLVANKVKFVFVLEKLKVIRLYFDFHGHDYSSMVQTNVKLINELKKRYGKPEVSLLEDLTVKMLWTDPQGLTIKYKARILEKSPEYSFSFIEFAQEPFTLDDPSKKLSTDHQRIIRSAVLMSIEEDRPESLDLNPILSQLKDLKPLDIKINNNHKVHYCKMAIYPHPEDMFYVGEYEEALNNTVKPDGFFHTKIISKDSHILQTQYYSSQELQDRVSYFYQEGYLKALLREDFTFGMRQKFWLDYDKRGYLSRVITTENGVLKNIYYVYAEKDYERYVIGAFDVMAGKAYEFKVHWEGHNLECDALGYSKMTNPSAYTPKIKQGYSLFKINKWRPLLPNMESEKFTPKKPVNCEFLKSSLYFSQKIFDYDEKYQQQTLLKTLKILEAENPFAECGSNTAVFFKEVPGSKLPFVINQVDKKNKKAIQLKTPDNRLVTVFKNQTLIKTIKLIDITDEGGEFEELSSGRTFFMKVGEEKLFDKSYIFHFKGEFHELKNGETLMGNKLLAEKGSIAFLGTDDNLIKGDSIFYELPGLNEKISNHKLKSCTCFDNPAERSFFPLSPSEVRRAQSNRIDDGYLLDFCMFRVDLIRYDEEGKQSYIRAGTYAKSGNSIKQILPSDRPIELALTVSRGGLRINGKALKKTKHENTKYFMADLADKKKVGVKYIPANAWSLRHFIHQYAMEYNDRKYNFQTGIAKINQTEKKFAYEIDPEKSQITIDGKTFDLDFEPQGIYLTSGNIKYPVELKLKGYNAIYR